MWFIRQCSLALCKHVLTEMPVVFTQRSWGCQQGNGSHTTSHHRINLINHKHAYHQQACL